MTGYAFEKLYVPVPIQRPCRTTKIALEEHVFKRPAIGRTRKLSIDTPVLLLNLYWAVENANSHIKIFQLFEIYYRSKKNRSTSAVVSLCGKYVVLSGKYLSMITSLTRNLGFRERHSSETCKTTQVLRTRWPAAARGQSVPTSAAAADPGIRTVQVSSDRRRGLRAARFSGAGVPFGPRAAAARWPGTHRQ